MREYKPTPEGNQESSSLLSSKRMISPAIDARARDISERTINHSFIFLVIGDFKNVNEGAKQSFESSKRCCYLFCIGNVPDREDCRDKNNDGSDNLGTNV